MDSRGPPSIVLAIGNARLNMDTENIGDNKIENGQDKTGRNFTS